MPENSSLSELFYELENDNLIFKEINKDPSIKIFLNLKEIKDKSVSLRDGDEVAFLPPVTGG